MIPDGWTERLLGDLASLSAAPAKKSDGSGYVIVDMGSVAKNGSLLSHKMTDDGEDMLQVGDLVMPKDDIGGGQIIGKAVHIDVPNRYVMGDHVYRLRLSEGHPQYVRYAINSHSVNSSLRSKVVGSAQLGLGRSSVLEQPILFPPLAEQLAIAEAISDADALVESLDALIAKKRDMKQAAMQQLLTGRTRLPGFSEEWLSLLIGDIASLSAAPAKVSGGSHYVIVDMGSVAMDGSLLTHKKTDEKEDLLEVGDLVMPKDDIGGGQIIGKAIHIDVPNRYVLGDHVYRLRLSQGHPLYVRYAINSHSVNSSLRSKVVGSAQLGLGRRSVLEQPILFPPLDEQQAIAEVLSDMDAEIDALVAQREKAELVKQGMMQELLSGRARLV
jgi:type I restriction enzyme S subunit